MDGLNDFLVQWADEEEYITAHTSGSTGTPKQIRLLKSDLVKSALATNRFFNINGSSALGLPLSIEYIAGKMMAVRSLVAKCKLIMIPVSNQLDIPEKIDLLSIVPTQIDSLIHSYTPDMVRAVLIGGAAIGTNQEAALSNAGFDAWIGYGMTETCSHVALRKVGGDGVYHAMPGIRFEKDKRGCLTITSKEFSWQTIQTNDVVELISPTSFKWLGRYDNVINSGGIKLHPEVLEKKYRQLIPYLPPFYLIGIPDEKLGEKMVMVALRTEDDIYAKLYQVIEDHRELPKKIYYIENFKQTKNGKLLRLPPDKLPDCFC